MSSSLETLQATVLSRLQSKPLQDSSFASLGSEVYLESLRQRNTLLDWVFYDIRRVRPTEARKLSPILTAEGAILLVPPSGRGELASFRSINEFVDGGGKSVKVLAVAGVGSSALGAAAFARNIADALDTPVCAVVSGYGLADALTEGLGGFFWFSMLNRARHAFEWLDRLREDGIVEDPTPSSSSGKEVSSPLIRWSKDVTSLVGLLQHPALSFDVLAGHSKGNLVLSEALFELERSQPRKLKALGKHVRIVTVSAKIAMPRDCTTVIDVMGTLDTFGLLNSTPGIPTDMEISGAWHNTNTQHCYHLDVRQVFGTLLEQGSLSAQ